MNAHLLNMPESIAIYEAALEGLARINERIYDQKPSLPEIHDAGVKYRRERGEAWRHAADVVTQGWGDCEDLAAARVGWLRSKNVDKGARVKVIRTGPKMTHAIVERSNGTREDPSKDLGMRTMEGRIVMNPLGLGFDDLDGDDEVGIGPLAIFAAQYAAKYGPTAAKKIKAAYLARKKRKAAAKKKKRDRGEEPTDEQESSDEQETDDESLDGDWEEIGADLSESAELSWTIEKTPTGWRGTVRVPLDLGRCLLVSRTVEGSFPSMRVKAIALATKAASRVLDNPYAASKIPPQARAALNLAKSPQARNTAWTVLKMYQQSRK